MFYLNKILSQFSLLYFLTSKKVFKITYYINLFVRRLSTPSILQDDNEKEF